jgi:hypothetical protein
MDAFAGHPGNVADIDRREARSAGQAVRVVARHDHCFARLQRDRRRTVHFDH